MRKRFHALRASAGDLPGHLQSTPPRVPTPASDRLTAQRLKRRGCPRRGSGSSPLRFRLRRSDSAGPALRITLGRQTESHSLGRGGEGRGKADREGRWKRDGCARTSVLASVPASAAGAAGIFKLRVKERWRKKREEREADSFIHRKWDLPSSNELRGRKTTNPTVPRALNCSRSPTRGPGAVSGMVVFV